MFAVFAMLCLFVHSLPFIQSTVARALMQKCTFSGSFGRSLVIICNFEFSSFLCYCFYDIRGTWCVKSWSNYPKGFVWGDPAQPAVTEVCTYTHVASCIVLLNISSNKLLMVPISHEVLFLWSILPVKNNFLKIQLQIGGLFVSADCFPAFCGLLQLIHNCTCNVQLRANISIWVKWTVHVLLLLMTSLSDYSQDILKVVGLVVVVIVNSI